MRKSEIFLQLLFILLTASLIGLIMARVYPEKIFKHTSQPVMPLVLIKPVPEKIVSASIRDEIIIPPTEITIPSIRLDLPVIPGVIVNNEWSLFDDKVSWLSSSETPGNGNVILYAHNRDHLFAGLKQINLGSDIVVTVQNKKFVYTVSEKRKVTPQDIDAVLSDKDQLTLYTCDGTFDQRRLIVIAYPKTL